MKAKHEAKSKTVKRAFQILEYLKEENGGTLNDLATEFDKPKSTLHRDLTTLECLRVVKKEGSTYHPGLGFLDFSEHARNRIPGFKLIQDKIEEVATETEERAQFLAESHGKGVYVDRSVGSHGVRTDPTIGQRVYLHTTAAGKAVLAELPSQEANSFIDYYGLPAVTENTITDRDELFNQLSDIEDRGYSVDKQECLEGLHSIGVPVRGPKGDAIGALSVSGPSHRMEGEWFEQELPNILRGVSNELELNIKHAADHQL